jgi:hypothetical protein
LPEVIAVSSLDELRSHHTIPYSGKEVRRNILFRVKNPSIYTSSQMRGVICSSQTIRDIAASSYKRMLACFYDASWIEVNPVADGRHVNEEMAICYASFCYDNEKMHLIR